MSYLWTLDIPSEKVLSSFLILISVTHAREPRSGPNCQGGVRSTFWAFKLLVEDKLSFKEKDKKFEKLIPIVGLFISVISHGFMLMTF